MENETYMYFMTIDLKLKPEPTCIDIIFACNDVEVMEYLINKDNLVYDESGELGEFYIADETELKDSFIITPIIFDYDSVIRASKCDYDIDDKLRENETTDFYMGLPTYCIGKIKISQLNKYKGLTHLDIFNVEIQKNILDYL